MPTAKPLSAAAQTLGLGAALSDQASDQNEEERKKRLARAEQMRLMGPAAMALGLNGTGAFGAA